MKEECEKRKKERKEKEVEQYLSRDGVTVMSLSCTNIDVISLHLHKPQHLLY